MNNGSLILALVSAALIAGLSATCGSSDDSCESVAECGFAVSDHDIVSVEDCPACCTQVAASTETVARRKAQYQEICDTTKCNAVDCKPEPSIGCMAGTCEAVTVTVN